MKSCQKMSKSVYPITRRDFIHGMGLAAAGLIVAGCTPKGASTAPVVTDSAVNASTTASSPRVAIARAASYDPKLVQAQVQKVLDDIGGVSDILAHGTKVAIKVNLTGGTSSTPLPGISEIESYLTHPEVVKALVLLLRDAGAKDISIVEAVYEEESWSKFGYTEMAASTGAKLVSLNSPAPFQDFVDTSSGTNPNFYEKFKFNPILNDIDAFISVSKMKCHNVAGVTHTMKNLFGIAPLQFYRAAANDTYRSGFHGQASETGKRVPGIIVDLNRTRPVNLSLIDGILTTEGGEGPWINGLTPIKPGILIAGKDPVATDSVATAAMGFDPTADFPNEPFVHGVNHLKIAASEGLGTNNLAKIKVVGEQIADVKMQFKASY